MKTFDYLRPTTIAEAVAAASEPGAAYLAGGTNLLDLMKGGITQPRRLVDVNHLPGLAAIEQLTDGGVRIGARVRNADLAHDAAFARRFPAVAEALLSGASAQLRNAATVGGNLLQRTRCAYFYDVASACNKRQPGAGCEARGGDTRLHAVLGWSDSCIATNPSDFCVPLVAFDAVVEIAGKTGHREVSLESFHRLPGETPERESVLEPGELIVAVRLPAEAAGFCIARPLSEGARAHVVRLRSRVGCRWIADRGRRDRRGADRPWRRRAEAVACTRGRDGAGWRAARWCRVPACRRGGARRCDAVRRQRLQDRARAADRDAGSHIGCGWHAGSCVGTAGVSLLPRSRSFRPCLKSRLPQLWLISDTALISASR